MSFLQCNLSMIIHCWAALFDVVADVLLRLEGLAATQTITNVTTTHKAISEILQHEVGDSSNNHLEPFDCQMDCFSNSTNDGNIPLTQHHLPADDVGFTTCPVCGKRVQLSYLSLHMKRTHDSLEAKCQLCGKKFKNKHSLGVHLARYHPKHGPTGSAQILGLSQSLLQNNLQQQLQDNLFSPLHSLLEMPDSADISWTTQSMANASFEDLPQGASDIVVKNEALVEDSDGQQHLEIDLT